MKDANSIALEAVLDEPLSFEFELPFTLAALDREPLLEISPVRLSGSIARIEGGFALEAQCAFHGLLECSRCLAPYAFEADELFSLFLCRRPAPAAGGGELSREDIDVSYYEADLFPVAPIAEERVQMAIPMKPLCREECRGLCALCGEDLNLGACGCVSETADPRWNALRDLKGAGHAQKG